jgi:hypothetical protein
MSERWHRSRSATLSAAEGSRKRSKSWDFEATTDEELTGFNPAAGLCALYNIVLLVSS